MNNDTVTIRGFIGNDPQPGATTTGVPVLNFRVGSGQRKFDKRTQSWVDAGTNWYAVSAYRQLADHARTSLRKGDAVIITGRLKFREWENASGVKGASLDLEAEAIGHDLQWGTSNFRKAQRSEPLNVDAATGEVFASAQGRDFGIGTPSTDDSLESDDHLADEEHLEDDDESDGSGRTGLPSEIQGAWDAAVSVDA